jgi:hypothetical protein
VETANSILVWMSIFPSEHILLSESGISCIRAWL